MTNAIDMAMVAALIGDPARANILSALTDGRAQTASELAYAARVSPQTTSGHLAKLTEAQLLAVKKQGRHRYYRLASPLVGRMLEAVMAVAAVAPPRHRSPSKIDDALRAGRTCYDHLAGRLGVELADTLVARTAIHLEEDGGEITAAGAELLVSFGVKLPRAPHSTRPLCRPCMDWTERRPHIAGALGAALLERFMALGWLRRAAEGRILIVTSTGQRGLAARLGLRISPELKR
jgi:DNA-binding transcriptional ArsR family regulator